MSSAPAMPRTDRSASKRAWIYIAGDPTIDWAVVHPDSGALEAEDRLAADSHAYWHRGGVFLLQELLKHSTGHKSTVAGYQTQFSEEGPKPYDPHTHHSFNTLKCYTNGSSETYRIAQYIGFRATTALLAHEREPTPRGSPGLVVIDDAGLGFSCDKDLWSDAWRLISRPNSSPWVVLRLHRHTLAGSGHADTTAEPSLMDKIRNGCASSDLAERLVVVMSVGSLRTAGAEVSYGLSWERSAQDILAELARHHAESLGEVPYRRLVVSFGPTGALLIALRNGVPIQATLFFDRRSIEGEWERAHSSGKMFGYNQILTAAIASRLAIRRSEVDSSERVAGGPLLEDLDEAIGAGIEDGLASMRAAYESGFALDGNQLVFPACMKLYGHGEDNNAAQQDEKLALGSATIELPDLEGAADPRSWSILDEELRHKRINFQTAVAIAKTGEAVLKDIPIANFSELVAIDKREIESLRTVRNIVTDYWQSKGKATPRSIAVFGAPGSGKSFAVKQVVQSLRPGKKYEPLAFNLSQFRSIGDLYNAFHQVRDRRLRGDVPLVFWDEFDTPFEGKCLGWLPYFLAPMQDGVFLQGEVEHPIGRAIFVFAGGTCRTYAEFKDKTTDPNLSDAKGVDFLSRLQGYLEVTGPNAVPDASGPNVLLHRALLLHGLLQKNDIDPTKVHDDVIRAFLLIDEYQHGTRSMATIVDLSNVTSRFGRSSLPPQTQLGLHVDAVEFLKIARKLAT